MLWTAKGYLVSGFSTAVGHVICGILFTVFWLAEAVELEVIGIPESSVHRAVTGIVVLVSSKYCITISISITITSITISVWSTWDENLGPSLCANVQVIVTVKDPMNMMWGKNSKIWQNFHCMHQGI